MLVSVRLMILFCALTACHCVTTGTKSHNGISGKHIQAFLHGNRIKRALITKGVQASLKAGAKAAKKLLAGARFLYSNGLDSVFVKAGGLKKALEDFDSVVDPEKVRNLPTKSKDQFPQIIDLNVGGDKFSTLLTTLTKAPGSLLADMFSGHSPVYKDSDGHYFIDADPDTFKHILNFLRTEELPPQDKALSVYKAAVYFKLKSLVFKLSSYKEVFPETYKLRWKDYDHIFQNVIEKIRNGCNSFIYDKNACRCNYSFAECKIMHRRHTNIKDNEVELRRPSTKPKENEVFQLAKTLSLDFQRRGFVANIKETTESYHLTIIW